MAPTAPVAVPTNPRGRGLGFTGAADVSSRVTSALAPVADVAAPLAAPVTDALDPVTTELPIIAPLTAAVPTPRAEAPATRSTEDPAGAESSRETSTAPLKPSPRPRGLVSTATGAVGDLDGN